MCELGREGDALCKAVAKAQPDACDASVWLGAGCCLPYIPHACTARGRVGDPMVQRVCTEMTHVCWGHEAVESYVARSACRNIHAYPGTVSRLAILARTFSIFHIHISLIWLRLFCHQQQGSDSAIKYTEFCLVNQFYWTNPRIALVPGWSRWSQGGRAGRKMIPLVAGWKYLTFSFLI